MGEVQPFQWIEGNVFDYDVFGTSEGAGCPLKEAVIAWCRNSNAERPC